MSHVECPCTILYRNKHESPKEWMALFGKCFRNLKEEASSCVSWVREDLVGRITPEGAGNPSRARLDAGGGGAKRPGGRRTPRMILAALL